MFFYITFMAYLTILSVALTRGARIPGARLNFVPWCLIVYLWVLGMELTCHPSGAQSFEVTSRFFKNLTNPGLENIFLMLEWLVHSALQWCDTKRSRITRIAILASNCRYWWQLWRRRSAWGGLQSDILTLHLLKTERYRQLLGKRANYGDDWSTEFACDVLHPLISLWRCTPLYGVHTRASP